MRNLWIDLTDLEQWPGHHGGTQRVVYGIAKNYFLSGDDSVRFFSYSPAKDIFYETSFAPIYERVEALRIVKMERGASANSIGLSKKQKIKLVLKHRSPAFIKNNPQLKDVIKKNGRKAAALAWRTKSFYVKMAGITKSRVGVPTHNEIVFSENDTVLILGKPWDNPGLQELLFKQKPNGFKVAQVVYDLIISLYPHLHHPALFDVYTKHMFGAVQVSDLLLPISKSSERDLRLFCERLHLPVPKTAVIRLGDTLEGDIEVMEGPGLGIEASEFMLCVGTIENRKNHALLYQAYKLGLARGLELPKLVIVGGQGWLSNDIVYLIEHDPQVSGKIVILNNINDHHLSWLYQNCLFTVYPSLYEGWGLPVAESMAYGKPCLASNVSSIPEIAGELIEYFSPFSTEECLALIQKYSGDKELLSKKEKQIKKMYKTTDWHETYGQVDRLLSSHLK